MRVAVRLSLLEPFPTATKRSGKAGRATRGAAPPQRRLKSAPVPPEASISAGRKWSIGALVVYVATLVLLPGSFGGSLAVIPLAMVLTAVGWWRERPSRPRRVAIAITLAILAASVPLLVYHLIWGDLNVAAGTLSSVE